MDGSMEEFVYCWDSYSQVCTGIRMSALYLPTATLSSPCPWLIYLNIHKYGDERMGIPSDETIVFSGAMPLLGTLIIHCENLSLRIETSLWLRSLSIEA